MKVLLEDQKTVECTGTCGVYGMGIIGAAVHTLCMLRVVFCKANIINHYFCDLFPLMELACTSTFVNEVVLLCLSAFNIFIPTLIILCSYIFIIASILRIKSTEGRFKAFSTCSSHFSAVAIFFGSLAFMYLQPLSFLVYETEKFHSIEKILIGIFGIDEDVPAECVLVGMKIIQKSENSQYLLGFSKCLPFLMQNEAQVIQAEESIQMDQRGLEGNGHGVTAPPLEAILAIFLFTVINIHQQQITSLDSGPSRSSYWRGNVGEME
ncbi:hypothetical protein ACRRTK_003903 [Alexandromys fortis]